MLAYVQPPRCRTFENVMAAYSQRTVHLSMRVAGKTQNGPLDSASKVESFHDKDQLSCPYATAGKYRGKIRVVSPEGAITIVHMSFRRRAIRHD